MGEFAEMLIVGVAIVIGGLIAGSLARKRSGGKQSVSSYAMGVYDLIMGIFILMWALDKLNQRFLPDDVESIYSLARWFGIIYLGVGVIELIVGAMQSRGEEEQERKDAEFERLKTGKRDSRGDELRTTAPSVEKTPAWKRIEMVKEGEAVEVEASGGTIICPKCGTSQRDLRTSCSSCGVKFFVKFIKAESHTYCVRCGTRQTEGNVFCGKCGAKLHFESSGDEADT